MKDSLLMSFARYLRHAPVVMRKMRILHEFGVFLDEASPRDLERSLRAWRIFKREQGYLRSLIENKCVDKAGNPIPWYTYPAIEQLSKWDFSGCSVLEYGCGNSTLWWMERAAHVTSIESSLEWYEMVSSSLKGNCDLHLSSVDESKQAIDEREIDDYVNMVDDFGKFDVIIVDGVNQPGVRKRCAEKAIEHLKDGGLMIVDNTDWLPETCAMLRDAGFMEMDYAGLGPLNEYAETTSLFFWDSFMVKPLHEEHPGFSIGGLNRYHDEMSGGDNLKYSKRLLSGK